METEKKQIAVLGSTGSIGTQTLDIIDANPDKFGASLLTANRNWKLLAEQARRFRPERVVIADPSFASLLRDELFGTGIDIMSGQDAVAESVGMTPADTVVTATVGYSGLLPTIEAIKAGRRIALANKETLVVAGELITRLLRQYDGEVVPVDSEHSAIFQCLQGEDPNHVNKIILTASGGPFRTLTKGQLRSVTVDDALHHPNWSMGAKVTIDSASMMNKGFEMIEARWLFGVPAERIQIVVHPQSIIHSMVEYDDGAVKAQLGCPDMHLPISYALGYPKRIKGASSPLSIEQYASMTFEKPDLDKFPLLGLAFKALERGGNTTCSLNAADEVAVSALLARRIRFVDMPGLVEQTIRQTTFIESPTLEQLIETHREATEIATWLIPTD